ncbi:MAG: MgpA protein [Parcubacteria group bacterium GW2011_GWC2_39_14]|nr:MAG: MgpA protein [Parcubacteria group bacterium GW2011_GWC2_39_14]KKR55498.1 MAG: MgpA protein [Parcubacteria group bacterium GW2011_GWA2_40_23]
MSLTQQQQLYETIQKSQYPLITFHKEATGDVVASSLALGRLLKKWNRSCDIIAPQYELPDNFKFLEGVEKIKRQSTNLKRVTISLDHPAIRSHHLEHEERDNQLHIHINSDQADFTKENIKISETSYKHDLIITLNTPDLSSLEKFYEDNTEFFFNVPIINIDYSPENEHYGHINLINITATSVSEILYDLIDSLDPSLMDEQMATHLLTGMIERTKSFKIPTITPKSLNIASQLMAAGAERDSIIKNLYQTRSVNTLRLWGKTLLKLETDVRQKIAWTEITEQDFFDTRTDEKDLSGVLEELISNIPTVELSIIFFQKGNQTYSIIKSEKGVDLRNYFSIYNPQGQKTLIKFPFNTNKQSILETAAQIIL